MKNLLDEIKAASGISIKPISVEMYHRMIDVGILHDGDPVELLDGLLVLKDRGGAEGDLEDTVRSTPCQ